MAKRLIRLSVVMLFVTQAAITDGQVINSPLTKTHAGVQQAGGAAPGGEIQQTGWKGLPLPKITLPKITMPNMSSVTKPVKSGFGKMKAGSKKAWEGTKEMFSFVKGKPERATSPRLAAKKKPSFWQKLMVRESEPQVPQTVGEFMSQPRLNP